MAKRTLRPRSDFYRHNMGDVAKRAGVSKCTVSRVLRDDSRISTETKRRVREAVEELNYRPNILAQSIFTRRTQNIGVVLPDAADGFTALLLQGIEEAAFEAGYGIQLVTTIAGEDREREGMHRLIERRVDGIIVMPLRLELSRDHFNELIDNRLPLVVLDRLIEDLDAHFVLSDDRPGACAAVEHLISLGHRDIAHLRGPMHSTTANLRAEGYKDALRKHGIRIRPNYIIEGSLTEGNPDEDCPNTRRLLDLKPRPTAVFAFTDFMAATVLWMARREGLRIPEELSLVGFANLEFGACLEPPLTTVSQPCREMGAKAVETLVGMLDGEGSRPERIILPTELLVRKSAAPPPA